MFRSLKQQKALIGIQCNMGDKMSGKRYDYGKFIREIKLRFHDELEKGAHIIITEDESIEFFGKSIKDANIGECILEKGGNPESINATIPRQLGLEGYSSKLFIVNNERRLEIWKTPSSVIEEKGIDKTVPDILDRIYKEVYNVEGEEVKRKDVSSNEIYDRFQDIFVSKGINNMDDSNIKNWIGINPDEEEKSHIEYGNELLKRSDDPQVSTRTKISISKEIREEDTTDLKQFLLEQYEGHCQVCNTTLDLGSKKKPYFEIYRIDEKRSKNGWANNEFNVLCLCPNCHALMKYGGRDLRNILETAKKVLNAEIVPKGVEERSGDFYVVKINVAGKERELFYSPKHMETLIAFIEKTIANQNLPRDRIQKDEEKTEYQNLEQQLKEIKKRIEELSKNYKIK